MTGDFSMAADAIGQTFANDLEMALPTRPRIPPELVVLPFADSGMLFEGLKGMQLLSGRAVRSLLPRLLPELNGDRTLDELTALFPSVRPVIIRNIITLLYSRGLLEDGRPPPAAPELADVDAFLGRFIDVTRLNRNRADAHQRLQRANVGIGGSADGVDLLTQQLTGSGIGRLRQLESTAPDLTGCTLMVTVTTSSADNLDQLLAAAHDQGVQALHIRVSQKAAAIGPVFVPGESACYLCMRAIYGAPPADDARPESLSFWLSLAALQIFQLVSRIADPYLYNVFKDYQDTPHGVVYSDRSIARMPGCKRCGIAGPPLNPESDAGLAWLLHSAISMPPREFLNPRVYQNHYNAANIALTSELSEPFYGAPTIALPPLPPLNISVPWSTAPSAVDTPLNIDQLGALLGYAAGYQQVSANKSWRIAPTGGSLGSPELFVIAREVAGLQSGVYHYYAPHHVLELLQDASAGAIQAGLGTGEPLPPCIIVGTGALSRLRGKYGNFSYRLVNLDAGVALSYLHSIADGLGIPRTEYADMHDRGLADAISLPSGRNRYVTTFALGLGGGAPISPRQRGYFGLQILDFVINASAGARASAGEDMESTSAYGMPEKPPLVVSQLGRILLSRRSIRSYTAEPLPSAVLTALMALSADSQQGRSGSAAVQLRPFLALRLATAGLPAGIYGLAASGLVLRREGFTQDELLLCLTQKTLAAAPAVVFMVGDLASALARRGARGYRELLLQAGAAVGRLVQAATAYGVASCPSGGIMEQGLRTLAGMDGYKECPLFAVSLGYSAGR